MPIIHHPDNKHNNKHNHSYTPICFYGRRAGQLKDPFGHHWTISMHIEDVTPEELHRRAQQMFAESE